MNAGGFLEKCIMESTKTGLGIPPQPLVTSNAPPVLLKPLMCLLPICFYFYYASSLPRVYHCWPSTPHIKGTTTPGKECLAGLLLHSKGASSSIDTATHHTMNKRITDRPAVVIYEIVIKTRFTNCVPQPRRFGS